MSEEPPRIERHEAQDRAGKASLSAAQRITEALGEAGLPEGEDPIVLRTDGPHRSIDALAALIDAALDDDGGRPDPAGRPPRTDGDDPATTS